MAEKRLPKGISQRKDGATHGNIVRVHVMRLKRQRTDRLPRLGAVNPNTHRIRGKSVFFKLFPNLFQL